VEISRPRPDRVESDDTPQVVVRSGGRVRAALRCPYCHDQVGRQGALACARRGCGALYHRECWEECARWDGCAALACGSREAREVSALGYLVRWLRLLVAALLFPRRVARALRAAESASAASIFRRALDLAWVVAPSRDETKNGWGKVALHIVSVWPLAALLLFTIHSPEHPDRFLVTAPFLLLALTVVTPFLLALVGAAGLLSLRALALAFHAELSAFGRQEAALRSERSAPIKDDA
jgi:hypothetical protein